MSNNDISRWMPLDIGDHLAETIHLSTEEQGAYLLLKMHYWHTQNAIKNDKILLKNITGISVKKMQNILVFFEEKNGYLFHQKLEKELIAAQEKHDKSRARTSAATAAATAKRLSTSTPDSTVTDSVTDNVTPTLTDSVTLSPRAGTPTTNTNSYIKTNNFITESASDYIAPKSENLDFSDFFVCVEFVGLLFGRKLRSDEQELLGEWCFLYDMRIGMPKIEVEMKKFRKRNASAPGSVNYFIKPVIAKLVPKTMAGKAARSVDEILKETASKMRIN